MWTICQISRKRDGSRRATWDQRALLPPLPPTSPIILTTSTGQWGHWLTWHWWKVLALSVIQFLNPQKCRIKSSFESFYTPGALPTSSWYRPEISTAGQTSQNSSLSRPAAQVRQTLHKNLKLILILLQTTHTWHQEVSLVKKYVDLIKYYLIFSDFHSGDRRLVLEKMLNVFLFLHYNMIRNGNWWTTPSWKLEQCYNTSPSSVS